MLMKIKVKGKSKRATARKRERGDGMVGYLIVLALVSLFCIGAATGLGGAISGLFNKTSEKVNTITP